MSEKTQRRNTQAWVPTDEERKQVEQMVSVGVHEVDIAAAMRVTKPTLRKHCKIELRYGRAKLRGEVVSLLWAAARKGNVSAQKKLVEMTEIAAADDSFNGKTDEPAPRPARLGKKQEAAAAAARAGQGTEWGDDLAEALPN